MGIIFNNNNNNNNDTNNVKHAYKRGLKCYRATSHVRASKTITRRNAQFLKSLGLRVIVGGRK